MICDPNTLVEASKCFTCFTERDAVAVWISLLCPWAAIEVENPPPPCHEFITNNGNGTVTLHWTNPIVYDSIEIIHKNLIGGGSHVEAVLAGTATIFTTPVLGFGDFFLVQAVVGDDRSPFAVTSPCP